MSKLQYLKAIILASLMTTLLVVSDVRGSDSFNETRHDILLSEIEAVEIKNAAIDNIHDAWNTLLSRHVVTVSGGFNTQVDYVGMNKERVKLQGYLKTLTAVKQSEFDSWNNSTQLAFLINAYNAWTIEYILINQPSDELKELESIKDLGRFYSSPWNKSFIPLLGKTRSLDDIEHGLIRSTLNADGKLRYKEPRIHFAVNCASIGCPALREEAYVGNKLDEQLELQTIRFLSDQTRNVASGNTLKLSSIFKWYKEDFGQAHRGANSLQSFLALYSDALKLTPMQLSALRKEEMKIRFLTYNWNLNGQP